MHIWKALEKGFSEMYGLGGGSGTVFFRKLDVMIDCLGFFCLFWSGFRQTALHSPPPTLHCIPPPRPPLLGSFLEAG